MTSQGEAFPLGRDLDGFKKIFHSITEKLIHETYNVENDQIIKVIKPDDVSHGKSLAKPGEPHSIEKVFEECQAIFDNRLRVNHPRFMGLIPSPVSPVAWLGDVISSAFNALGASKLQASGPIVIEKNLIEWLGSKVGLPSTMGGLFVSGGSMGNLMATILARDRHIPPGEESKGVVYLSTQTHYSVAKALRFLAFQPHQIRKLEVDDDFRMKPSLLQAAIARDRQAGLRPFLVVSTCGTTNTGAVDPINEIATICNDNDLWLHVDGAYGASAALSKTRAGLVSGLAAADSLSWDAHKWLLQTYSCGILLVRDKANLVRSFANDGEYLRDGVAMEDEEVPNFWNYSLELTRPSRRALKFWFTLRVLGVGSLAATIEHGFELAERAEMELQSLPSWTITSAASLGIVTFRFTPANIDEGVLDKVNTNISQKLVADNIAGILTTKVRGKVVLRICALSPLLSLDDMSGIIAEINGIAEALLEEEE